VTRRPRTPKGREALSEIELRLGGLLGAVENALSEALDRARDGGDAQDLSGERTAGGVRAQWSVRVGPAAGARGDVGAKRSHEPAAPRGADPEAIETEAGWVLAVEMPGADPATLSVDADGERLIVRASGLREHRLSIPLPPGASPDGLETRLLNGILEITMPRRSEGREAQTTS
jgi:hypothetical protein